MQKWGRNSAFVVNTKSKHIRCFDDGNQLIKFLLRWETFTVSDRE